MAELRPSKKYAVGTTHELLSGEMEIIDRFLGDDGFAMLRYKMLETGEIEENKEVNIASNIAKARKKEQAQANAQANQWSGAQSFDASQLQAWREEWREVKDNLKLLAIQTATIANNQATMIQRDMTILENVENIERQLREIREMIEAKEGK